MKNVELYGRVRYAVQIEGLSERAAARRFKGSFVIPAIIEELLRLGYVEKHNLLIERYSGEGRAAHYPDLARQIVSRLPTTSVSSKN